MLPQAAKPPQPENRQAPPWRRVLSAFTRGLFGGKSSNGRNPLGPLGEHFAEAHLKERGFRTLARNARVRGGEADLLMLDPDGQTIVLVEVKARRTNPSNAATQRFTPEASVHAIKRRKLRRILTRLVKANRWHDRPTRIDVVAVEVPHDGVALKPTIRHTPDAVDPRGND